MNEATARLALPLLAAGQAHKERTVNEALTAIDALLGGSVAAVGRESPPADAAPGTCWIVGAAPAGAWAGRAGHVACRTNGGWRFVAPVAGMRLWSIADAAEVRYDGDWRVGEVRARNGVHVDGERVVGRRAPAIDAPSGGPVVDAEARAAIDAILQSMRAHGLIAE